jgi:hypothetical protein
VARGQSARKAFTSNFMLALHRLNYFSTHRSRRTRRPSTLTRVIRIGINCCPVHLHPKRARNASFLKSFISLCSAVHTPARTTTTFGTSCEWSDLCCRSATVARIPWPFTASAVLSGNISTGEWRLWSTRGHEAATFVPLMPPIDALKALLWSS